MNEKDTVYKFPAAYAREHGELEAYRASRKLNIECAGAISEAINNNYKDNCLDTKGVKDVISKFGAERTMYVLANTVQQQDWDGGILPITSDGRSLLQYPRIKTLGVMTETGSLLFTVLTPGL